MSWHILKGLPPLMIYITGDIVAAVKSCPVNLAKKVTTKPRVQHLSSGSC